MYQQEVQFPPGACSVPGGPGPSPGAVLGDFFPETDRPQTRSQVVKATPRSRPRSSRRSEAESRYTWCPVPYQQPQGRPNTGGSSQPIMMPPRGPVNQHLVRQRTMDGTTNTMIAWQERPGPQAMPPPPPPPPRPPPYPSAERPYEYTQPPPAMGGGESFPAMHGHMPPSQQMMPPQYQTMQPMQQGATQYEFHGAPDCSWRQVPVCHSAPRPPFAPPQYVPQPQQARPYYHQQRQPNVQYAPQYQSSSDAPGTWAPPQPPPPPPPGHNRQTRYVNSQSQPQVMTLPPMTTPPPGHYYVMERPPSQPLVKMYDVPEKENANVPPAYYNTQRGSIQTPSQQLRVYGQQQCGRYSQAVAQSGSASKLRGHHPAKQYPDNQKAYTQMHQDMALMSQAQQAPSRQYATYNTSSEQLVKSEQNNNLQQYPYFYRYSETVKTSQPLSDHCDMNAGAQNLNSRSCSDHSLPVVSHQTKSTIISSKSVSEVQMLVGVAGGNPGGDYKLTSNLEHSTEPQSTCSRLETATPKLTVRSGSKQHGSTVLVKQCNSGTNLTRKQSVRSESGHAKEKSAKVPKRTSSRTLETRCNHSSSRGSCKRRLSDSSEVSTMPDRSRVCSQGNDVGSWQQTSKNDATPVPKLDLGNLALCDDESDFEDLPETNYKSLQQTVSKQEVNSNGVCAFLEAINKEAEACGEKVLESKTKGYLPYDPFNPGSASSFQYSIDAERLVASLCYSSPEGSPPSSARMHLDCNSNSHEMRNSHARLMPDATLSNIYNSSHEQSEVDKHLCSEVHNQQINSVDSNGVMSDCDSHSNSSANTVMCEGNRPRISAAVIDPVLSDESVWKEGVLLISKGLSLLKLCNTKEKDLVKRFEGMVYNLERESIRGNLPDCQNSFVSSGERRQYSSRLSYVDQLYEYKSNMVASEETTDLFEVFPPVDTDLPQEQEYQSEQINDESQLLDSAYSLAKGKTIVTTPVQSREINWRQYEDVECLGDVDTNNLGEQDSVANNIDESKWPQLPGALYPFTEQTFTISKQIDQHSVRRDFPPEAPYESFPSNNDGSHTPWSAKLWESYPNEGTIEEMYQQTLFYQQNEFEHLMHGQGGFISGRHNELGLLSRNESKDCDSQSLFQHNSSSATKDSLCFSQKNASNCEQDIHYLQSAASKVAPVRCNKKGGFAASAKARRRTNGQTPCTNDGEGDNFSTPTPGFIDTESDDNISYYMKPGNYLVPKKPMSARLRTEKKVISRSRRKAFSAPAKTSIFIPYPLDPVVPPLPQLPQNPPPLFGASDVSLRQEASRLPAARVKGMNDAEHFSNNSLPSFISISKHVKENKKTNSPVTSTNVKDRKKKDNPRAQYPKVASKEVRQFQILRRVSKNTGKVDSIKPTVSDITKVSELTVVNQANNSKSTSVANASDASSKNSGSNGSKELEAESGPILEEETISHLQTVSSNDNSGQQRNRKNAAMKSILNFKVKSKVCEKANIEGNNAQVPEQVLSDVDSRDTSISEVLNAESPISSQRVSHDTSEQTSDKKSVTEISTNESKQPSNNSPEESENNKELDHSQQRHCSPGFNNVKRKLDAVDKIPTALPPRVLTFQRARATKSSDNISAGERQVASPQRVGLPPAPSVNRARPLRSHTSAPNISLHGPIKRWSEPPISRQFAECREKLERLNAQKTAHPKITTAGSDDSSSTTSMNSRHRRGPTPVALGKFEKILRNVCGMPESQFVKHNVSSSQLREYYQIVKYPIFLENIENKLKNRYYMTIEDIVHDFRQILFNSRLYFKDSPEVLQKTETLEIRLNELLNEYFSGWDFRLITGDPAERLRNRR